MKLTRREKATLTYYYLRSVCGFTQDEIRQAWKVMQFWQFEELAELGYKERNFH